MTARDEAVAHIQACRDYWYPTPVPPGAELDSVPSELLHRVADERRMTGQDREAHAGRRNPR